MAFIQSHQNEMEAKSALSSHCINTVKRKHTLTQSRPEMLAVMCRCNSNCHQRQLMFRAKCYHFSRIHVLCILTDTLTHIPARILTHTSTEIKQDTQIYGDMTHNSSVLSVRRQVFRRGEFSVVVVVIHASVST